MGVGCTGSDGAATRYWSTVNSSLSRVQMKCCHTAGSGGCLWQGVMTGEWVLHRESKMQVKMTDAKWNKK